VLVLPYSNRILLVMISICLPVFNISENICGKFNVFSIFSKNFNISFTATKIINESGNYKFSYLVHNLILINIFLDNTSDKLSEPNLDCVMVKGYHRNDIDNLIVENTIALMSEPLILKLHKIIKCECCRLALITEPKDTHPTASNLLQLKKPKAFPSKDLVDLCIVSNNVFEASLKLGKMSKEEMIRIAIKNVKSVIESDKGESLFDCLMNENHDIQHRDVLIDSIISQFICLRRHKYIKMENSLAKNYRGKLHNHLAKYCN
jgi:hypothetical protein